MKTHTRVFLALAMGLIAITPTPSHGQDSGPLLNLLIRKGILSDQEAEDLRADLVRDFSHSSAGKWNVSSGLSELKLAGDGRVRYEARGGEDATGDHFDRERFRYRFRLALTGRYQNAWFFGTRLETGSGARSTNVTFGGDAGPFGKADDGVNLGQLYVGWQPNLSWTLMAGRMPNPLVTTSMVWDGDLNPEGLVEQFRHRAGKSEFFATFGQFLYDDANPENAFGTAASKEDQFLLAFQAGWKLNRSLTSSFQIAPVVYAYTGGGDTYTEPFGPARQTATNDLLVLEVPVEYNWTMGAVPVRLFGDFAINFDADDRALAWGQPDMGGEDTAYQVGFQYGKAKLPREWDLKLFYQSTGAFALDPNLVDSDLFNSRINVDGFGLSGNYFFTDFVSATLTYAKGGRKEDALPAIGSGDVGTGALEDYYLLQGDLNFKF